jgi:hypothetical protein
MQNHYEINVSLNGKHLFATAERSARDKQDAERLFRLFAEKFPERDGYSIRVTHWQAQGERVTFE